MNNTLYCSFELYKTVISTQYFLLEHKKALEIINWDWIFIRAYILEIRFIDFKIGIYILRKGIWNDLLKSVELNFWRISSKKFYDRREKNSNFIEQGIKLKMMYLWFWTSFS